MKDLTPFILIDIFLCLTVRVHVMAKRVDLTLTIHLPDQHDAERMAVDPDGHPRVFDKAGREVVPKHVERAVHYERSKGPKYQTRSTPSIGGFASVGGLDELARLESFIIVDTNSTEIEGIKVSAAFFLACRLIAEKDGFRVVSLDQRGHVYEFHNVPKNSEMLAILKIAHDTLRGRGIPRNATIGFVTDSEMGSHEAISTQKRAIYGKHNLPRGFSLNYASSDTGQELANKLIRFCDRESTRYLARLRVGSFRKSGLAVLDEDPSVRYRYTYYPDLEIINPVVRGTTTTLETRYAIHVSKDDDV
jgi:hypothetical protein